MAHYQGTSAEGAKARALANEREDQLAAFKKKQEQIKQANQVKLLDMNDLFTTSKSSTEDAFKASTVGLVSAADFKKKRIELETAQQALVDAEAKKQERERKRKGRERDAKKKSLSFSMDEEEEQHAPVAASAAASSESTAAAASSSAAAAINSDSIAAAASLSSSSAIESKANDDGVNEPASKKTKLSLTTSAPSSGKDPLADTSFLPDRARQAEEDALRAKLAAEWRIQQEKTKAEQIQIVYSYWDGSGHRHKVQVSKGTTIAQFLEKARKDIVGSFHELRGLGSDSLMYIKEDLIIPHNYSFYDLIVTKARGKSGPLFQFDVHDDVRMTIDASVEKDESHAGKIVTRSYYERNKTNFPASRWEVFDPAVVREKYSIKGGEVRGAHAK